MGAHYAGHSFKSCSNGKVGMATVVSNLSLLAIWSAFSSFLNSRSACSMNYSCIRSGIYFGSMFCPDLPGVFPFGVPENPFPCGVPAFPFPLPLGVPAFSLSSRHLAAASSAYLIKETISL